MERLNKRQKEMLEFLDYRVKWSGLDPENAETMA